jgi:2-hydroxychromene-2-carboxylate isomerase
MRTVLPLRLALAAEQADGPEALRALSLALFRAYWVEDRDLADVETVRALAAGCGIAPATFERAQSDPAIKQALFTSTDEAVRAGASGVPTFVVRGHVLWGQDRLELVARALAGWEPPTL